MSEKSKSESDLPNGPLKIKHFTEFNELSGSAEIRPNSYRNKDDSNLQFRLNLHEDDKNIPV